MAIKAGNELIRFEIPVNKDNVSQLTEELNIEEGTLLVNTVVHKFPSILQATGQQIAANLLEPYKKTQAQIEWRKQIWSQTSHNDLGSFLWKVDIFIARQQKQGKATDKFFEIPCGLVIKTETFTFSDELVNDPINTHSNGAYIKNGVINPVVFDPSHPMNKLVMAELEKEEKNTWYKPATEANLNEILEYIPWTTEKEKLVVLSLIIGREDEFLFSTKGKNSKHLRIEGNMYKPSFFVNNSSSSAKVLMIKELDFRK